METTRRTATRIARIAVAKNDRVDAAQFYIFLGLAIIGSVVPWVLAAAIPFGLAWLVRGIVEINRKQAAETARVRDYEERMRSTYERAYLNV